LIKQVNVIDGYVPQKEQRRLQSRLHSLVNVVEDQDHATLSKSPPWLLEKRGLRKVRVLQNEELLKTSLMSTIIIGYNGTTSSIRLRKKLVEKIIDQKKIWIYRKSDKIDTTNRSNMYSSK